MNQAFFFEQWEDHEKLMETKIRRRKEKACGVFTKSVKGERRRERMKEKLDQEGRGMKEEEKPRERDKNATPVTTVNKRVKTF